MLFHILTQALFITFLKAGPITMTDFLLKLHGLHLSTPYPAICAQATFCCWNGVEAGTLSLATDGA